MKALRQVDEALHSSFGNIQSIELDDLPGVADWAYLSAEQVETALDDQPIDTAWATHARRELAGLEKAMTRTRDELANNLGKLSDVDGRCRKPSGQGALEAGGNGRHRNSRRDSVSNQKA